MDWFNAVYAKEFVGLNSPDRQRFVAFLNDICRLDKDKRVYELIWQKFPQSIRVMLDNRYIFTPFWEYHNGNISEQAWQEDFEKAYQALADQDTHAVLMVIFVGLYTLRNQIIHGGATHNSSVKLIAHR